MLKLTAHTMGVTIDSYFAQPRPFSKDEIDKISLDALGKFRKYGIKSEDITLKTTDVLFGYELSISLFGGIGGISYSADRLSLRFQDVRNLTGLQVLADAIQLGISLIDWPIVDGSLFTAFAHAQYRSDEQKKMAEERFTDPKIGMDFLGQLVHLRLGNWPETIRLEIDRSYSVDGIFIRWNGSYKGDIDQNALQLAVNVLETATSKFSISLEVLK